MVSDKQNPVHPGTTLLEDFLKPMGLSQNRLALDIRVPARRINEIVHGKRRITADTALRLARYFETPAEFWLELQMDYDLAVARSTLADRIAREVVTSSTTGPEPLQTGAKQTMASWAKAIESKTEVPEIYNDALQPLLQTDRPFPHAVLTPSGQMVCEIDDILYVFAADESRMTTRYPVTAVNNLEVGSILLHSWITIYGQTSEGEIGTSTLEFNTSTMRYFQPFVDKIRAGASPKDLTTSPLVSPPFDQLAVSSYKFAGLARNSLMGEEPVHHLIWQPEISERILPLIRLPFFRTISTAHLSILTDRELILIREDERFSTRRKGIRYGGVWRYIPLRSIVSVATSQRADNLLTLSIGLTGNDTIDRIYAQESSKEVAAFQNAVEGAIK